MRDPGPKSELLVGPRWPPCPRSAPPGWARRETTALSGRTGQGLLGCEGAAPGVGVAGTEQAGLVAAGAEPRAGDSKGWSEGSSTRRTREAGTSGDTGVPATSIPHVVPGPPDLSPQGRLSPCSPRE